MTFSCGNLQIVNGRCVTTFYECCIVSETFLRAHHDQSVTYVVMSLLESYYVASGFNIDGKQNHHTGNLIEHTGLFRTLHVQCMMYTFKDGLRNHSVKP
jgi:hypothetical protein